MADENAPTLSLEEYRAGGFSDEEIKATRPDLFAPKVYTQKFAGSIPEGKYKLSEYRAAGFDDVEIADWRSKRESELIAEGASEAQVKEYFGEQEPNFEDVRNTITENMQRNLTEPGAEGEPPKMRQATSFTEAFEAGFDMSVTGLLSAKPDTELSKDSPWYYHFASGVGQLAGDVPAMAAGAVLGGAAGSAVAPVAGTAVGGFFGAGFLTEGFRKHLIDKYEKGEVRDFADFWERTTEEMIEATKGGVINTVTMGVGNKVAGAVAKKAAAPLIQQTARVSSEIVTMTTLGAALDGRVPEPEEFINAGILIGGLHGGAHVAKRIKAAYVKSGVTPSEIVDRANADPKFKQELLSNNNDLPKLLRPDPDVPVAMAEPPRAKPKFIDKDVDVAETLSKIGEKDKPVKSLSQEISDFYKESKVKVEENFNKFYTDWVDRKDPLKRLTESVEKTTGEKINIEDNPYVLSRLYSGADSLSAAFVEKGTRNFKTGEINGKGLKEIYESVDSLNKFRAVLIAKRALERTEKGFEKTGFNVETSKKIVEKYGKQYEAATKDFQAYNDRLLQYLEDSGLKSPDEIAAIRAGSKDYASFERVIEDLGNEGAPLKRKGDILEEFKGSERNIKDPLVSAMEATDRIVKRAEENRVKLATIETALKANDPELISRVEKPGRLKDNQVEVFEKGERVVYETSQEVATVLKELGGDGASKNLAIKLMGGITTAKKIGITLTPAFQLKNFIRDTTMFSVMTSKGILNPTEVFGAMRSVFGKKGAHYENWLASGGGRASFLGAMNETVSKDVFRIHQETGMLNSFRNVGKSLRDLTTITGDLSENTLRLVEYKRVFEATEGPLRRKQVAAGFASREITLDFQRMGAKMGAINAITAFSNVSIQGLNKTYRNFKANPKKFSAVAVSTITVPSILLWWAQKDDERYKQIPRWQKDLFWIVHTDDWQDVTPEEASGAPAYLVRENNGAFQINKGVTWRIPKPAELGVVFASIPERILESYVGDNPDAFKDLSDTISSLITPNFVPDAISAPSEIYHNTNYFTGRDIIPDYMTDLSNNKYQYVEYTSETAKLLGGLVAEVDKQNKLASPLVIEHIINSWSGTLGGYALSISDKALKKTGVVPDIPEPTTGLESNWFFKSFTVRFPSTNSPSIQDFYENAKPFKEFERTINVLKDRRDLDALEKEFSDPENALHQLRLVDKTKKALAANRELIQNITKDPEIPPDEKRQLIDSYIFQMIEIAEFGNQNIMELKALIKEEQK